MRLKQAGDNLKLVFKNWKYSAVSITVAILFFIFNVFVTNIESLFNVNLGWGWFNFFLTMVLGFHNTVELHSWISLIVLGILIGVLFSLILYKTRMLKTMKGSKTGLVGTIGIFLGILAPGCAACGMGLLPLLGVSAISLNFLPFHGLEISVLSGLILLFSIYYISCNLTTCKVKN